MELACRGYMTEPELPMTELNWPSRWSPQKAAPLQHALRAVLENCIAFAHRPVA
jgi:N-formylglutamate deformylase